jgi:hypothetical protein
MRGLQRNLRAIHTIQTKIVEDCSLAAYKVGDFMDIDYEDIETAGYHLANWPADPLVFSLVDTWHCKHCTNKYRWVQVDFDNGVILSMTDVKLDQELVDKVNYVSSECEYFGWGINSDYKLVYLK